MPHAVPPRKAPNATRRSREYLTPPEVDALIAAARWLGWHGHRDATMLHLVYRYGLRVSELVAVRWERVDLQSGVLHVRRRKNGLATTHPLYGPAIRALRAPAWVYPAMPYVFVSERQGPLVDATVRKIVARAGEAAHLGFPVHPHMLRHATGFKLANEGHDTRGWAVAMQGQGEAGLTQVRQGIAAVRATGTALLIPYFCTARADVSAHLGHTEAGSRPSPRPTP
jgi:type 1 fimbriae regulatory protein FimB